MVIKTFYFRFFTNESVYNEIKDGLFYFFFKDKKNQTFLLLMQENEGEG